MFIHNDNISIGGKLGKVMRPYLGLVQGVVSLISYTRGGELKVGFHQSFSIVSTNIVLSPYYFQNNGTYMHF